MLIPLALLLQGAPAVATPEAPISIKTYLHDEFWFVSQHEDVCLASTSYAKDDTDMHIFWKARTERTVVVIRDRRFKSLAEGEEHKLSLVFRKGTRLDDGWGEVDTYGDIDSDGKPGFRFTLVGSEALTDFATSNLIALLKDEKIVDSLSLAGSSKAVAALRRCGADVIDRNPVDPFEK